MEFEFLGPYKIDAILGQGGMGTVYKAHHSKSGDVVAVKVIADSIANQERFRRRFDAEIESLERLTNKHIVKLIGYGEERGRLFYSMEYVEGENLQDKIRRVERIDWESTLRYGMQVCFALKHAHDIGVIHRDLKPANLLIDKQDNIKMTDFGIAKLYGGSDETVMGAVLGTADYMPPEQAEGTRVTIRSDLYALGAVLYACLSGKSPHYAKTTPETLYNVRYKIPTALRERYEDIPRELDILILELLEKDPKRRPPTALVVWNRMAAMQAGLHRMPPPAPSVAADDSSLSLDVDPQNSLDLSDVDKNLVDEIRRSDQDDSTHLTRDTSGRKTNGLELTLASNELMDASHMGHTTNIATHLTSLTNEPSASRAAESTFRTVEERVPSRRTPTFEDEEDSSGSWANFISIAVLCLGIVVCLGGIYFATRRASADSLYQNTLTAVENSSSLETINSALQEFKSNYPDDSRLKEFSDIENEIAMQRTVARLARRIKRTGESAVSPLEHAFVSAMQMREQNVSLAVQELRDLLTVFQNRELLDPDEKLLVEYASHELMRLTLDDNNSAGNDTELLQDQLRAALQLDVEKRRAFYQSVIRLYADRPYAKSLVAQARKLLADLGTGDSE